MSISFPFPFISFIFHFWSCVWWESAVILNTVPALYVMWFFPSCLWFSLYFRFFSNITRMWLNGILCNLHFCKFAELLEPAGWYLPSIFKNSHPLFCLPYFCSLLSFWDSNYVRIRPSDISPYSGGSVLLFFFFSFLSFGVSCELVWIISTGLSPSHFCLCPFCK